MRTANTDHDEATIRATWHEGEEWLGTESMQAPKHGAPRAVWQGVFPTTARRPGGRDKNGG